MEECMKKLVLVASVMFCFNVYCSAAVIQDVACESYLWNGFICQSDTITGLGTLGQTWTTSSTVNNINKLRLLIGRELTVSSSTLGDLVITVYDSVGGNALGNTSIARENVGSLGIYEVPFSSPVALLPSTQYYFELSAIGGDASTDHYVTSHGLPGYSGGVMYFARGALYADVDQWFDTYYESTFVPEPATISILLVGLLGVINRRK
jgi:hypothetical protein